MKFSFDENSFKMSRKQFPDVIFCIKCQPQHRKKKSRNIKVEFQKLLNLLICLKINQVFVSCDNLSANIFQQSLDK